MDLNKYNQFIDNIINQASNEDLVKLSNPPPVPLRDSQAPLQEAPKIKFKPVDKPIAQKPAVKVEEPAPQEDNLTITNEPVRPIDFGGMDFKSKNPITKPFMENQNAAIEDRIRNKIVYEDKLSNLEQETNQNKLGYKNIIERLQGAGSDQYSNPDLDKNIQDAYSKIGQEQAPERDLASQLILSLGPALFGSLTGESGQIAQLQGGEKGRQIFEGMRKEDIDRVNKKNDLALKRYQDLVKLKQSGSDAFDKKKALELQKLAAETSVMNAVSGLSAKQLESADKKIEEINKETAKARLEGGKDVAGFENDILKEKGKKERANIIASGAGLKDATKLRQEFLNLPEVKNFAPIKENYQKIQEVLKTPSAAGDISLIFSFMKMNDPSSVVREGEQASAQNAAGVPDQIRNIYNKLLTGERLTPEQRQDFAARAGDLYNAQQKIVSQREEDYKGLGTAYGTNPSLIIPRISSPTATQKDVPKYKDGDMRSLKEGNRIINLIRINGQWREQ